MKYQSEFTGKITRREAISEVEKILASVKVPESTYCKTSGGIDVLVGSRRVSIAIKAGLTYFEMRAVIAEAEAVARDFVKARAHKNQIDIEDAIRSKEAAE